MTGFSFDANGSGNSITNIESADIANDTILEEDLNAQGTLTDEFCLTYETGGGALFAWQDCSSSTTLQTAYVGGNTIDITTGEGALDIDAQSANIDFEVGEGTDTGDFRVWDGSVNWILVDESADTLILGAAAGSGITLGGTGITTTNAGALTVS